MTSAEGRLVRPFIRVAGPGILALFLLATTSGCALLLRAAPAGARAGAAAGAARGAAGALSRGAGAARGGAAVHAPAALPRGLLVGSGAVVGAGIGALALGRVLPPGTARIYSSSGQSLGYVESRGKTAIYYDHLGRPSVRSELDGSTMHFYDATGRRIGYSKPSGASRVNFYTSEGELVGYEVFDQGRIIWHFDATGTLIGYTLLGEVDLAALGIRSAALGLGFTAAIPAVLSGDADQTRRDRPILKKEDRSMPPVSQKVVDAADRLFAVGNRCRTEGNLESCRSVTLAYVGLSEAIREEVARLTPPKRKSRD